MLKDNLDAGEFDFEDEGMPAYWPLLPEEPLECFAPHLLETTLFGRMPGKIIPSPVRLFRRPVEV